MKRYNVFADAGMEVMENIGETFRQSIGGLTLLVQIIFPLLIASMDATTFQKLLVSTVWIYLTTYLVALDRRLNRRDKDGFPLPPCELTKTDKNGFVEITEGHIEDAVIYLSDIEDYIKRKRKGHKPVDMYRKT